MLCRGAARWTLAGGALFLAASVTEAQNRGQYILGSAGLNAGIQAPAGFTIGSFYVHYEADAARDASGHELPVSGRYRIDGGELLLSYTSPWTIAGGTYGAAVVLFYIRGQLAVERFASSAAATGFADAYFEPINLGWKLEHLDMKVAYGFIAPTGVDGVTTDYYGQDLTFAMTFAPDAEKLNQFSLSSVTEFHHRMRNADLTIGDNTNLELAAGRTIPLNGGAQLLQIGVVGYGQWQFSDDQGTDAIPALAARQDRVFALGGEIDVVLPAGKWGILVRASQELAARSRAEGYSVLAGITKSF